MRVFDSSRRQILRLKLNAENRRSQAQDKSMFHIVCLAAFM